MNEFKMKRLGVIMEPEPWNIQEAGGILNPAAVRGMDGQLYLFPRIVAKDNYSRISIARVKFNKVGDPVGVERLGIALEPEADYEKRPNGGGGCEDPRISYVEPLEHYIMTYTAFSPDGPRIALAQSKDLFHWERLGLATYMPYGDIEFNGINNKDACLFPIAVPSPHGHKCLGMLHRPLFPGTSPEEKIHQPWDCEIDCNRESIWLSYCHMHPERGESWYPEFTSHRPMAFPMSAWEMLKIGAGTPPVLTKFGWMFLYHGVKEGVRSTKDKKQLCYSTGLMILSEKDPCTIIYRSPQPILKPELPEEQIGVVDDVVFPTGIDCRHDLGTPNRFDVYFGMADYRIGVARLDLPDALP
ncbi:MAG: glycosidase [Mariniphaga sp.]|nr:glycosidase [Mariniphaga sp.]